MTTINLKDFYAWYTHDEYIEVSDEVAAELKADKLYEAAHQRRTTRNKAQYSLDCDDGIEYSACLHEPTPQELLDRMELFIHLWNALNSLPEVQGIRVEAHPGHPLQRLGVILVLDGVGQFLVFCLLTGHLLGQRVPLHLRGLDLPPKLQQSGGHIDQQGQNHDLGQKTGAFEPHLTALLSPGRRGGKPSALPPPFSALFYTICPRKERDFF